MNEISQLIESVLQVRNKAVICCQSSVPVVASPVSAARIKVNNQNILPSRAPQKDRIITYQPKYLSQSVTTIGMGKYLITKIFAPIRHHDEKRVAFRYHSEDKLTIRYKNTEELTIRSHCKGKRLYHESSRN